ncbi:O187 family O-antigen flippase, partial [Escherichia coli]|nr:O187 family O-antigen flippase [Escherichia coli]
MNKLLSVTFLTGLLTFARMVAGFIVAKIVAIYTGPTGIAMLGQLQNVINGVSGLVNSPLNTSIVRFTAENYRTGYEECAIWWRVSIRWAIIIYAVIAPMMVVLSKQLSSFLFESDLYYWVIIASALALPFTAVGTLINSIINGQQLYIQYVLLGMVSVIISSMIMISLVVIKGVEGALIALALQNAIIGIAMFGYGLRRPWFKLQYFFGNISKEQSKIILGYTFMALVSALTMPVVLMLIRKFLVMEVGWEHTGYWQAVWKISETYLAVVTMSLSIYYLPQLSSINDITSLRKEIYKTVKVVMPIVILMAFAIYMLRDIAISLLFTETFKGARDLFLVQLCGDVVKILSWLFAYALISRGETKLFIASEAISAITFILLAFFCIKFYGVQGANIAYLANYVIYF